MSIRLTKTMSLSWDGSSWQINRVRTVQKDTEKMKAGQEEVDNMYLKNV